ncbi:hypothetical protein JIY74_25285 [Vibrio harveyi]|nr:hypothetical protein [Vibrio harveyi]
MLDMQRILSLFLKDVSLGKIGKISLERVLDVVPEEIEKAVSYKKEEEVDDISAL